MRIVRNHIYIHWSNNMINRRRNDNTHLIIYKMLIGLVFFFFSCFWLLLLCMISHWIKSQIIAFFFSCRRRTTSNSIYRIVDNYFILYSILLLVLDIICVEHLMRIWLINGGKNGFVGFCFRILVLEKNLFDIERK